MSMVINILEQAFIFALVSMGVYITYKILDFPDLSVDGTFPLGACICGTLLVKGFNPIISTIIAMAGGAVAGFFTALLHVKLKITNLMSGILVMMALYSINLVIMGRSNISLINTKTIFINKDNKIIIILLILILFKVFLDLFMKTKTGYLLKAVGDNEQVVTTLGVNKNLIKIIGLVISNALVSLAGALNAEYVGYADVGMGTGIVVKGLATVIIGISIFSKVKIIKDSSKAVLGSIIYYFAITIALNCNLNPNLLNLLTAIVIIVALASQNKVFKSNRKKQVV